MAITDSSASPASVIVALGGSLILEGVEVAGGIQDPETSADGHGLAIVAAVAAVVLFFGSVFLHELSHSLMAIKRGLKVRRIRLFIFGGVSEIEEEAETPSDELAVTLAGPLTSLGLGIGFLVAAWPLSMALDLPARIALILGLANVSIAVFNLLPGLPLDGGRMLRALLWRRSGDRIRATRLAVRTGRILGALLMVFGVVVVFTLRDFAAIWFVAVGWFLFEAATTSAVQEAFSSRIEGVLVGDVMRPTESALDGNASVAATLAMHGWGDKLRAMPVPGWSVFSKSISSIENGRYVPSTYLALKLARVFRVPVEELFQLDDESPPVG